MEIGRCYFDYSTITSKKTLVSIVNLKKNFAKKTSDIILLESVFLMLHIFAICVIAHHWEKYFLVRTWLPICFVENSLDDMNFIFVSRKIDLPKRNRQFVFFVLKKKHKLNLKLLNIELLFGMLTILLQTCQWNLALNNK